MDDFRELYRRIEYLRNNGIKMKEIADCAGMAPSIIKRANQILKELESNNSGNGVSRPTAEIAESREGMQLSFFQLDDPVLCQIRDEILNLDINNLTPMEALNKLNEIKKIVGGK